jgi:hypothetical protein
VRIETRLDVCNWEKKRSTHFISMFVAAMSVTSVGPSLSRTPRMYTSSGSSGKATLHGSEKLLLKCKADNDVFADLSNYLESRKTWGKRLLHCIVLYCVVLYCVSHCSAELLFITALIRSLFKQSRPR